MNSIATCHAAPTQVAAAAEPAAPAAEPAPPALVPAAQVCVKCGEECTACGKWPVCPACNSSRVKLSIMFGGWPITCFKKLHPEAQKSFWKGCHGKKGKDEIESELVRHVSDFEIEMETSRLGGKYLPLSMYKTMGLTDVEVDDVRYAFDSTRVL